MSGARSAQGADVEASSEAKTHKYVSKGGKGEVVSGGRGRSEGNLPPGHCEKEEEEW